MCERIPRPFAGGLGYPSPDVVVNATYSPAPGWIRLVTASNLNEHQVVSEGINPSPELIDPVDFDITSNFFGYLSLFDWFEAFPFLLEFSTASEAAVFDEQANSQRAANELTHGSANLGTPFVLDYSSWRIWRFGFEGTLGAVDDLNGDLTPDLLTYGFGVEKGQSTPIQIRYEQGNVKVSYKRVAGRDDLACSVRLNNGLDGWAFPAPLTFCTTPCPEDSRLEWVHSLFADDGSYLV